MKSNLEQKLDNLIKFFGKGSANQAVAYLQSEYKAVPPAKKAAKKATKVAKEKEKEDE